MTPPIRVRRHTDGRVAIQQPTVGYWHVQNKDPQRLTLLIAHDSDLVGDGWSELFVAELPDPDGADGKSASWVLVEGDVRLTADAAGIGIHTARYDTHEWLATLRSDALKMLAAVAACKRYRAERKAGPS